MTREYQVSDDGKRWCTVTPQTFTLIPYRYSRWRDASDWELVEEPMAVTVAPHVCAGQCASALAAQAAQATIARLEHELTEAKAVRPCCVDQCESKVARLERERDLLKLTVKTCEEVSAALERELASVRDRLEFARAGNATLTACGVDTAKQLAEARRELAEAKRPRCCSCCDCGGCKAWRQNAALGQQGHR